GEGDRLVGLGELGAFLALLLGLRRLAKHAHIAAEGQQADLPARARAIGPAEELRAEADREDLDPHAIPARDKVVAELMDKDEHGQHTKKRKPVVDQHGERIHRPNSSPDATTDRGAKQTRTAVDESLPPALNTACIA